MGRVKIKKKQGKKKRFFSEKEAPLFRKRSENGWGVSKLNEKKQHYIFEYLNSFRKYC